MAPESGHRKLDGIALLAEAPPEVLAELEAKVRWIDYLPNEVIVDRDDESTDVFLISKGRVKVMDYLGESQDVALAEMAAGSAFGELSAVDAKKRSARVTALEHTTLAVLERSEFRKLLLRCPGIALMLLKRFAKVIRTLNTRITSVSTMTPHQRVYFELIRMSEPNPMGDGTWIIQNMPHHNEIASWSSTGPQDVATAIGQLAREGVVERKHKTLVIKQHGRLQQLANM